MWGALIRRSVVCCTPAPAPAPLSLRDDRVEGATTELTAVGGPRVRISLPPAVSPVRTTGSGATFAMGRVARREMILRSKRYPGVDPVPHRGDDIVHRFLLPLFPCRNATIIERDVRPIKVAARRPAQTR